MLLSGTPVVIELPDAGVRGEFLWPSVAPLAPPRRRHLVVPRRPRRAEIEAIVVPPDLPEQVAAVFERPYRNGSGGVHSYSGASNGFHAEPVAKPEQQQTAVIVPLFGPETVAEPVAEPESRPQAITVPEAAGILDVHPVLIDVAEQAVAPPVEVPGTPASAAISDPLWDTPAAVSKAPDALQWTPGKEPRGNAGGRILHGAAGVSVLLGIAIFALSGRNSQPPAPSLAGKPVSPVMAAQGSGSASTPPPSAPGGMEKPSATAAAITAAPALKPAAPVCPPEPEIATEPMSGGRMKLTLKSECRSGQDVKLTYGGATFRQRFDANSYLATVVDCFAGTKDPIELEFAGGLRKSVPTVALDLDRVTKVAVVWQAPVDLDLHAFEYAALPGGKGHVWSGAPAAVTVLDQVPDHRGHGFLSSVDGGQSLGDKLEVYTFFHNDEQSSGAVTLALDYATRGETATEQSCGKGNLAEIPYWVGMLKRGGQYTRENGLIAAAPCGVRISPEVRFGQSVLPVLRIKK